MLYDVLKKRKKKPLTMFCKTSTRGIVSPSGVNFVAELKEKDYLYCYLWLLGLDNVQIAALMQNSQSTIWDREKRLQKIFGSKEKIAVILYGLFLDCKSGY